MEIRFGRLIVLACMGLAVACTSGTTDGGSAGNTELNLDIVNPGGTSGELGFSIDRVDYRITCDASGIGQPTLPPANTAGDDYIYDDSVDISGAFEIIDTRVPPVWQAVMDLPPGDCTITLSVYEDDEIVCVGSQTLAILEDDLTKYNITLVCSLSIDTPDGMADVDGEFFFITGNLCPKLYVLNAIPSVVVQDSSNPDAETEIQFRSKDPDNTCGNNCDPQSCTDDNPPVCTAYPSNINDPICAADPADAGCLAGDHAGLVCTITALSIVDPGDPGTWFPSGNFDDPFTATPAGPSYTVNLNTADGTPGVVLPGLGGPAGTNAENSPAYPASTLDGGLAPLFYQCDTANPGPVAMNLDCSDGDAECDQNKLLQVTCPGQNFCIDFPVDCSGSNDCLTDGVCDTACDPADPCDRCPGQDNPLPEGDACSSGGGNVCDGAGTCAECVDSQNTGGSPDSNPNCDSSTIDCALPSVCSGNACQPRAAAPAGNCSVTVATSCVQDSDCPGGETCENTTTCSNGVCDGSAANGTACVFVPVDPPAQLSTFDTGCGVSLGGLDTVVPYLLETDPTAIIAASAFDIQATGSAIFPELLLDLAQPTVAGGVARARLQEGATISEANGVLGVKADVVVRSGATGPAISLEADLAGGVIVSACEFNAPFPGGPPTVPYPTCDRANNATADPDDPTLGNSDCCLGLGCNSPVDQCGYYVNIPIESDCSICDANDDGTNSKSASCALNGFCVAGGAAIPLDTKTDTFVAGPSGQVLVGIDDGPGTGTTTILPDGTYDLALPAGGTIPLNTLSFRVKAGGAEVAIDCIMAVDSNGPDGVGVPDRYSPTPDSLLHTYNIQVP